MWELPPCPCQGQRLDQYAQPKNGVKLDLGCAENPDPSMMGVDWVSSKAAVHCDLNKTLPFSNESVSFIRAMHLLEHMDDWVKLMDECWRVLYPNAICRMIIGVPRCDHWQAIGDPEHKHIFHPNCFLYLTPEWHYETRCRKWSLEQICWCYDNEMRLILRPIKDPIEMKNRMSARARFRKDNPQGMMFTFQ